MDQDRENTEDIYPDEDRQEDVRDSSGNTDVRIPESPEADFFRHRTKDTGVPADAQAIISEMREEKRKRTYTFIYGVLTGCLIFMVAFTIANFVYAHRTRPAAEASGDPAVEKTLLTKDVEAKINELAALLAVYYYEDVDVDNMKTGLYRGILQSVDDRYTAYYTAEEYESMMTSASATYYGIGAVLSQDKNTSEVTVLHVYDNTPAQEAGVMAGDVVISAGGIDATTVTLSELVQNIRGDEGSKVTVKLYRESTDENLELEIERRKVDIPTVSGEILENSENIGYIQIAEFGDNTADEFTKIYEDLKSKGMEKLIVDVRDNPGGMLKSVVSLCDYILPEGLVVYTEDKYENRSEYSSDASCIEIPMAVLINGNSASSSEIFAGAVRDYGYGTLIGTTTFGKGIVQTIKQLSDGSAVKMTTSRYFTPKGENIHGVGIAPDIELEYEYTGDTTADYDYHYDNQMMKAIEILTK